MDRFSIVQGHYWWNADHHEGQGSKAYARLSRISRYYTPGRMERGPEEGTARDVYDALCDKAGCTHTRDAR